MPQLISTSAFHYKPAAKVTLTFSFDCHTKEEGFDGTVYAQVASKGFSKHVQWLRNAHITRKGTKHSAIQPAGMVFLRPLYEWFARDFVRTFAQRGAGTLWIELGYTPQEVKSAVSAVSVAANNRCREMKSYGQLIIGAGVLRLPSAQVKQSAFRDPEKGLVTLVVIDHGPYPSPAP